MKPEDEGEAWDPGRGRHEESVPLGLTGAVIGLLEWRTMSMMFSLTRFSLEDSVTDVVRA